MRILRDDIKMLDTLSKTIALDKNQVFYETKAAYEIWNDDGTNFNFFRVTRIPKKLVFWIIPDRPAKKE